jgi:crossover junction endodeoxyribonuclease RuvC
VRIVGLDIALRCTGVGAVESSGTGLRALEFGLVRNPDDWPHSRCLRRLEDEVAAALARVRPAAAAIEGLFYSRNVRTAVALGEARGVVLAACAGAGVPVHEYAPREVKQSLVGWGAARKEQVGRMVASVLGLAAPPPEDAADALAIAVCHWHHRTSIVLGAGRTL